MAVQISGWWRRSRINLLGELILQPKGRKSGWVSSLGGVHRRRSGGSKERNEVTAFGPQCTHLGCAYHWEEGRGQFLCPCHTSLFSIDGKVAAGPAPRPLDRYQTRLNGSKLLLGKLEEAPSREKKS